MLLKFDGYAGLSIATLTEHPEIDPLFTKKTRSVVQEARGGFGCIVYIRNAEFAIWNGAVDRAVFVLAVE